MKNNPTTKQRKNTIVRKLKIFNKTVLVFVTGGSDELNKLWDVLGVFKK